MLQQPLACSFSWCASACCTTTNSHRKCEHCSRLSQQLKLDHVPERCGHMWGFNATSPPGSHSATLLATTKAGFHPLPQVPRPHLPSLRGTHVPVEEMERNCEKGSHWALLQGSWHATASHCISSASSWGLTTAAAGYTLHLDTSEVDSHPSSDSRQLHALYTRALCLTRITAADYETS